MTMHTGVLRLSLSRRQAIIGYMMILPWVIGLLIFNLGPIVATFYFSFTEYNVLKSPEFVGAQNYVKIFTNDPLFWQSLNNTAYYVVISVPLNMVLSFFLAYLLNFSRQSAAFGIFRTFFYVPYIVPSVAASIIWIWLLNNQVGIVNYALSLLHMPPLPWLINENWSKPALILVNLWWRIGGTMIIYLAALQGVPQDLYEAAEVDGANWWNKLYSITLPMVTPSILFTLILGVIDSFQVFNSAFVMTGGGPLNSTLFYLLYIYQNAFRYFQMGYASALAWILFVVVLILTAVLFRVSRFWVYYEGETP